MAAWPRGSLGTLFVVNFSRLVKLRENPVIFRAVAALNPIRTDIWENWPDLKTAALEAAWAHPECRTKHSFHRCPNDESRLPAVGCAAVVRLPQLDFHDRKAL